MSLLTDYIKKEMKNYDAPLDKSGIPRGEDLPFTSEKYTASLYVALTNKTLKEIAKIVGMPYESVRRWNTEKTFKNWTPKHRQNFMEPFTEYLKEREEALNEEDKQFCTRPLVEMAIELLPVVDLKEMKDVNTYNPKLVDLILDRVVTAFKATDSIHFQINILETFADVMADAEIWSTMKERIGKLIKVELLAISEGKDVNRKARVIMFLKRLEEVIDDIKY